MEFRLTKSLFCGILKIHNHRGEYVRMGFDQNKYVNQYNKDNYSSITFYISKARKRFIKERSDEIGISVKQLIFRALEQQYHVKFTDKD